MGARQPCVTLCLLVVGLFFYSGAALAQAVATLTVDDVSAGAGETVAIAVRAENVQTKIVGIQGRISYQPSVMQVTQLTFNEAFLCSVCITAQNVQTDTGEIRFLATLVMDTADPIGLEDTVLFTLGAKAVGNPGDSTPIDITFEFVKDTDHNILEVDEKDGSLTITGGENVPPSVDFSFTPANPQVNEAVSFNEACLDPDGRIDTWFWEFGDGNTLTVQTPSLPVSHSYVRGGSFNVSLTCTDNRGATGSATKSITVGAKRGGPTIYVFPNPCNGLCTFYYEFPTNAQSAELFVFNVRGERVFSSQLNLNTNQFGWNASDELGRPLPNGPYFFFAVVTTDQGLIKTPVAVLVVQK